MITSEQKIAINTNDKLILVKAGAGTGKTEVLTRRILRLLIDNPDLSIQQMAVITFTNKATENLLSRLKLYLYHHWKSAQNPIDKKRFRYELENLNSCQILTIHKFCKSILDIAGPISYDDFEYSPNFRISESSLYQSIEVTLESWLTQKEQKQAEIHHEKIMPVHNIRSIVMNMYNMLRSQGISIETALKLTSDSLSIETGNSRHLKQELTELLQLLYKNHQRFRLQTLDPDNLLEFCYKLLQRRPDIATEIKAMYQFIFVDEFQDTSLYQTGIIKLLCNAKDGSPNLFVVGDSKQSIYQFRGADSASYESVEKWISHEGKILTLATNFRSTGELVFYVNTLFERLKQQKPELKFKPEPLKSNKNVMEPISLSEVFTWLYSKDEQTQAQITAQYIQEQMAKGVSPNQFAILFRKNYLMVDFAHELESLGIPYQLIGAGNFYNQREIVDTYKVVNYLLNPNLPLCTEEALETIFFNSDKQSLSTFTLMIQPKLYDLTPAQLLESIYQKTKIREKLITNSPQGAANLNKLKELTRTLNLNESLQLTEFSNWFMAMITTHKVEQQSDIPNSDNVNTVTLITIHKAKGLEFPIVILPGLDDILSRGILSPEVIYNKTSGLEFSYTPYFGEKNVKIPSTNYESTVDTYQQDLYSEELRVLYVALTRAEKHLVFIGDTECPKKAICFQNWLSVF